MAGEADGAESRRRGQDGEVRCADGLDEGPAIYQFADFNESVVGTDRDDTLVRESGDEGVGGYSGAVACERAASEITEVGGHCWT